MRKTLLPIVLFFLFLYSCQSDKEVHPEFGKYYKIGEYEIYAPFGDEPQIDVETIYPNIKVSNYLYAYKNPTINLNLVYGVEVMDLPPLKKEITMMSAIKQIADNDTLNNSLDPNVEFIEGKFEKIDGESVYVQKLQAEVPHVGTTILNSFYVAYKKDVVRVFIYTHPENDGNEKILNYYKAVRFE